MRKLIVLMAIVLAGCDPANLDEGPVKFAIVAGDEQTTSADSDSLTEGVVGQAYRDASGAITFRTFGVRPLHAQTAVGTGVPNVLTCAEPVGDNGLHPWKSCETTNGEGFVTYWFDPGTMTGEACAEIRSTHSGSPEVLATTCATVEPGAAVMGFGFGGGEAGIGAALDTLDGNTFGGPQDRYGNVIQWRWEVLGGPAHVPSADISDDLSRIMVVDGYGSGTVDVITIAADTSTGSFTVDDNASGVREIRVHWP